MLGFSCKFSFKYHTLLRDGLLHDPSFGCPLVFATQLQGLTMSYANISLNAVAPVVVDVYSPKQTSPWGGVYTVGEEVSIPS